MSIFFFFHRHRRSGRTKVGCIPGSGQQRVADTPRWVTLMSVRLLARGVSCAWSPRPRASGAAVVHEALGYRDWEGLTGLVDSSNFMTVLGFIFVPFVGPSFHILSETDLTTIHVMPGCMYCPGLAMYADWKEKKNVFTLTR